MGLFLIILMEKVFLYEVVSPSDIVNGLMMEVRFFFRTALTHPIHHLMRSMRTRMERIFQIIGLTSVICFRTHQRMRKQIRLVRLLVSVPVITALVMQHIWNFICHHYQMLSIRNQEVLLVKSLFISFMRAWLILLMMMVNGIMALRMMQ